jgi:hypothetical protein
VGREVFVITRVGVDRAVEIIHDAGERRLSNRVDAYNGF